MATVYLNGEYLPAEQAKVSAFDRGFLFGDGIYEVVPIYRGRLHRWPLHLARLRRSLAAIALDCRIGDGELEQITQQLLQRNSLENASLYLQITRGGVPGQRDHFYTEGCVASVFAYVTPWPQALDGPERPALTAITVPDLRWQRCDIKSINLLPNAMARQQAREAGADEAILIRDGEALEGSSSNLYIVREGGLITPPEQPRMLSGITRAVILELAGQHGVPVEQRGIARSELQQAEEIWISSSLRELRRISRLDGVDRHYDASRALYPKFAQWFHEDKLR
ncbi:D-amino acid aminotransferase [Permianibacter sp. IMCC34836]|uniref:aminotransferase class IV n=1 Tax=Permianibacter fluminis TaxID=2738515 RepID=UPI0015536192|nr:aminotransferase class IV [Permianibacter fluminis]NQD36637.1 D-amino acid aminotransferase [Permianibacter fluminis]